MCSDAGESWVDVLIVTDVRVLLVVARSSHVHLVQMFVRHKTDKEADDQTGQDSADQRDYERFAGVERFRLDDYIVRFIIVAVAWRHEAGGGWLCTHATAAIIHTELNVLNELFTLPVSVRSIEGEE